MANEQSKSIDDSVATIEIKDISKSLEQLNESAREAVRKATGFKGDFSKPGDIKGFFSAYEVKPIVKCTDIIGLSISYSINKAPAPKEKPWPASGSGPKIMYKF